MKITAPAAANMRGEIVSWYGPVCLLFKDGVAEVDDDEISYGLRGYFAANGYGVDGDPVVPETTGPEHDSRDYDGQSLIGTPLRDAAVDPDPDDFLPPVNAGEADPHGPDVVAPGIHAEGERVVRSGPVSADPAEQTADEQAFAKKLLIDQEPITPPVAAEDWLDKSGPLGLSDPGSVQAGVDAAKAGQDFPDASTSPQGEPRGNASLRDWQAYAKSQGATDEQITDKSRDDLRAAYGS